MGNACCPQAKGFLRNIQAHYALRASEFSCRKAEIMNFDDKSAAILRIQSLCRNRGEVA
jgi:hypothetical protein